MRIKQGDLEPALSIDCTDNGQPVTNFDDAEDIRVVGWQGPLQVFSDDAPDVTGGTVTHTWVEGETDLPGRLYVHVVAKWPNERPQTFPNDEFLVVTISANLEPVPEEEPVP